MKRILSFFASMAVLLSLSSCGGPSKEAAFEADLQAFLDSLGNAGLSVAVVKDNQLVYTHSFGYACLEDKVPMTDDRLYRIASISKSFTATSLMQLIEAGKLSLDTDVSDLAGFPIRNPKFPDTVITVEMLLSHTSSINDSEGYFTINPIDPSTNPNWQNCYNDYRPGTGYEYCNLNFNLLGTFLEKLSGERFDKYVIGHVLEPLGLYGGYCVDELDQARFATLYHPDDKGGLERSDSAYRSIAAALEHYVPGRDTPIFSPTGGMKITAGDLARYMRMHMNYGTTPEGVRIIPEELSRQMQTPRAGSGEELYGLALWHDNGRLVPGTQLIGHTGGAYGLRSAMFFDPEKKFGLVCISSGAANQGEEDENILAGTLRRMYRYFIK